MEISETYPIRSGLSPSLQAQPALVCRWPVAVGHADDGQTQSIKKTIRAKAGMASSAAPIPGNPMSCSRLIPSMTSETRESAIEAKNTESSSSVTVSSDPRAVASATTAAFSNHPEGRAENEDTPTDAPVPLEESAQPTDVSRPVRP